MTLTLFLACSGSAPQVQAPPTPVEVVETPLDPGALRSTLRSDAELAERGRALVALVELGEGQGLREIHEDAEQPELLRVWAAAGRIRLADDGELAELEALSRRWPELERPISLRRAELGGGS